MICFLASGNTCGANVNLYTNTYLFLDFINCVLRQTYPESKKMTTQKSTDKTGVKVTDKKTDKSTDKPTEKPTDKPTDKPTNKPTDKSTKVSYSDYPTKKTKLPDELTSTKESTDDIEESNNGNNQGNSLSFGNFLFFFTIEMNILF